MHTTEHHAATNKELYTHREIWVYHKHDSVKEIRPRRRYIIMKLKMYMYIKTMHIFKEVTSKNYMLHIEKRWLPFEEVNKSNR